MPCCPASRTTLVATRFWAVMICPIIKCLTVLEFSFILFDLCLFITIFNFILNYVPIVTFWIFTYHKIWILLIIFCFIWSYWMSYSHVPECIEFSFILFIHHNTHFYFELCTYCNILDIYLSWDMNSVKYLFIWHYWIIYFVTCLRYSGVLWVNSCPPLSRPHQAVWHEWALLHHWLCNQKHPWGICSCSPIVNFLKVTFYHGMVTLVIFLIKK